MEVFWLNELGELLTYESDLHRGALYKFICVSKFQEADELVLVAGSEHHEHHYELFEAAMPILLGCDVVGAGEVNNKKIKHWYSKGFQVNTPDSLKPLICECLGVTDED